jgi:antitoxin (DNA-binding transcriptional repressor) of toxin-antitoxin stability system
MHVAKTHLSQLVDEVLNGEQIILSRPNRSISKIVPL